MIASSLICSGLYIFKGRLGDPSYPAILVITVAGSTVAWLVVTFLTAPVSEERLAAFYRKVRPWGAWRRTADKCGIPPARGLGRHLLNWLAGTVMVLGATFSAGKFLLGFQREGWLYLAAAVAGAALILREVLGVAATQEQP